MVQSELTSYLHNEHKSLTSAEVPISQVIGALQSDAHSPHVKLSLKLAPSWQRHK